MNVQHFYLDLHESFHLPIEYLYILRRPHDNDEIPFHIAYQIPLGMLLPRIHLRQSNAVHATLKEFFHKMNLYETDDAYTRKYQKFEKLSSCFKEIFNSDTSRCFVHSFMPYGSFRIVRNS